MENGLRRVAAERDALASESQRRRALVDERRAALAAKVKSLEYENEELRRLLNARELASELDAVRTIADRLVRVLGGDRIVQQIVRGDRPNRLASLRN
jgi:hypothetical protein